MLENRRVAARVLRVLAIVCVWVIGLGFLERLAPQVTAQTGYNVNLYSGLHWRLIGPFRGGRVNANMVTAFTKQMTAAKPGSISGSRIRAR